MGGRAVRGVDAGLEMEQKAWVMWKLSRGRLLGSTKCKRWKQERLRRNSWEGNKEKF